MPHAPAAYATRIAECAQQKESGSGLCCVFRRPLATTAAELTGQGRREDVVEASTTCDAEAEVQRETGEQSIIGESWRKVVDFTLCLRVERAGTNDKGRD